MVPASAACRWLACSLYQLVGADVDFVEAARPVPVGRTNLAETSMVWRSDDSLAGPDMQLMFIHVPFHLPHLVTPVNRFTFGVATVPDARGSIRLGGPEPATAPLIDPN
ncbi:MAG: hypothetical protein ABW137_09085 [Mycobacterium sp.]